MHSSSIKLTPGAGQQYCPVSCQQPGTVCRPACWSRLPDDQWPGAASMGRRRDESMTMTVTELPTWFTMMPPRQASPFHISHGARCIGCTPPEHFYSDYRTTKQRTYGQPAPSTSWLRYKHLLRLPPLSPLTSTNAFLPGLIRHGRQRSVGKPSLDLSTIHGTRTAGLAPAPSFALSNTRQHVLGRRAARAYADPALSTLCPYRP
ncbi:hypothetical protein BC834DRAFT_691587 [Gloeopeniophorella convolvens]|nr:hypothetical protein BC834DRAFT_691587 [Gloeopeniophorella convolvens]